MNEIKREIDNCEFDISVPHMRRALFTYIDESYNRNVNAFMNPQDQESKHVLKHLHKMLDVLFIDELFENLIKIDVQDFEQQDYFFQLEKY